MIISLPRSRDKTPLPSTPLHPSPGTMISDDSAAEYKVIEFRFDDGSWYDVRLALRGENLTVNYIDFPDEQVVFNATAYGTPEKVEDLERRFRPRSHQIQDGECSKVVQGMTVCASHPIGQDALHFYDAVVEEAFYKEHSFANNGEEECLCTFALFWQHGPNAGNLTTANIANICLIQPSAHTHPLLTSFLKMARRRFAIVPCNSGSNCEGYNAICSNGSFRREIQCLDMEQKSSFAQHTIQELNCAMQPIASQDVAGMVVKFCERIESDANMGGKSSHHIVLVDNLEKGLAASTIVDFIHKQTSITPQAYVFPNLSLDPYTRGIIALNCKRKFEKMYGFLNNPNHIITSSRGRPWVTTKKVSTSDPLMTSLLKSQNQFRYGSSGIGSQLKLVYLGTQEYQVAKQRRDLYSDFFDHLRKLHIRLVSEENEILSQRDQV